MKSCWTQADVLSARYRVEGVAEQPIRARDAQAVAQATWVNEVLHAPGKCPVSLGSACARGTLFQLRTVRHDPPVDRGVIDVNPTFLHELFRLQSRKAYATSHRTQVRIISCGKCTSLKRTASSLSLYFPCGHRGRA